MKKFKKTIFWAIFWLMLALVFSASATATLLKAYGYKVNLQAKKIQKTKDQKKKTSQKKPSQEEEKKSETPDQARLAN